MLLAEMAPPHEHSATISSHAFKGKTGRITTSQRPEFELLGASRPPARGGARCVARARARVRMRVCVPRRSANLEIGHHEGADHALEPIHKKQVNMVPG